MSYTENGGALKYFQPIITLAETDAGVLQAMDIGAASADHGEMLCIKACEVSRVQFSLTGELAGGTTTPPAVIFTKRPTPLSATGETVMKTLVIPDATPQGTTVFKDIDPIQFDVGDSMEISHTVGVGTPTGIGVWSIEAQDRPEYHGNNAELIEGA